MSAHWAAGVTTTAGGGDLEPDDGDGRQDQARYAFARPLLLLDALVLCALPRLAFQAIRPSGDLFDHALFAAATRAARFA